MRILPLTIVVVDVPGDCPSTADIKGRVEVALLGGGDKSSGPAVPVFPTLYQTVQSGPGRQ